MKASDFEKISKKLEEYKIAKRTLDTYACIRSFCLYYDGWSTSDVSNREVEKRLKTTLLEAQRGICFSLLAELEGMGIDIQEEATAARAVQLRQPGPEQVA